MVNDNIISNVKKRLGPTENVVRFLSECLSLSENAAYKRARGITPFTLEETITVANEIGLSIDAIVSSNNKNLSFTLGSLDSESLSISTYLKKFAGLASQIDLNSAHIYYASNEFPILHYFSFPRLNYFKFYMWSRTNWKQDASVKSKFSFEESISQFQEFYYLSREIYNAYLDIPSTEFICYNSLDNTIQQVKYFTEIGAFKTKEEAVLLCEELGLFLDHLDRMAKSGRKFLPGVEDKNFSSSFNLYNNEIIQSNNVCLVSSAELSRLFITLDNPNVLETDNPSIIDYITKWFDTMKKFAQPLGREVEKNRLIYFNKLHSSIESLKHFISSL